MDIEHCIKNANDLSEMLESKEEYTDIPQVVNEYVASQKDSNNANYIFTGSFSDVIKVGRKYRILYVDPPWQYKSAGYRSSAQNKYDTESTNDMKFWPIQEICEDDCIIFMWITDPLLKEGLELMESWGFEYKTKGFNWIKTYKDGSVRFGLGHYTRSGSESCYIGVRGSVLKYRKLRNISQVVYGPVNRHSEKPCEVASRIERFFGGDCGNKIEMFCRTPRRGWDAFGNQIKPKKCLLTHINYHY